MKVICINNKISFPYKVDLYLTINKVYEVIEMANHRKYVRGDNGILTLCNMELFIEISKYRSKQIDSILL